MLGIIIALQSEYMVDTKIYKKRLVNGFLTYTNDDRVFIYSGVGKANAAAATIILISNFKITKIINIGSVGSVDRKLKTLDVIVPNIIGYFDVDVSHFGYEKNQMAREKSFYSPTLEFTIPGSKKSVLRTGETFVTKKNYKSFFLMNGVVDMEGCAIAHVCSKSKIPCGFLKIVSDSIFEKEKSASQWTVNVKLISSIISNLIKIIKK